MAEQTESSGSLPVSRSTLQYVYIAGIALNLVALVVAATSGQYLGAATLGLVIAYLSVRFYTMGRS